VEVAISRVFSFSYMRDVVLCMTKVKTKDSWVFLLV
jgi:hypothetical protein